MVESVILREISGNGVWGKCWYWQQGIVGESADIDSRVELRNSECRLARGRADGVGKWHTTQIHQQFFVPLLSTLLKWSITLVSCVHWPAIESNTALPGEETPVACENVAILLNFKDVWCDFGVLPLFSEVILSTYCVTAAGGNFSDSEASLDWQEGVCGRWLTHLPWRRSRRGQLHLLHNLYLWFCQVLNAVSSILVYMWNCDAMQPAQFHVHQL